MSDTPAVDFRLEDDGSVWDETSDPEPAVSVSGDVAAHVVPEGKPVTSTLRS